MGRIFLEHSNHEHVINCKHCNTNLTNTNELVSTSYRCASGKKNLFFFFLNFFDQKKEEIIKITLN